MVGLRDGKAVGNHGVVLAGSMKAAEFSVVVQAGGVRVR
jgi:hypothetical protein